MTKMRIRLARKIVKSRRKRYSWGKYSHAMKRLGWKSFAWIAKDIINFTRLEAQP